MWRAPSKRNNNGQKQQNVEGMGLGSMDNKIPNQTKARVGQARFWQCNPRERDGTNYGRV